MLIHFSFENYRSYRDKTDFSMVAGKVQAEKDSLIPVPGQRFMKLLPLSAVYGANASGKSTLVLALRCLQQIVLSGKVAVTPFRLDAVCAERPTRFDISFVAEGKVWEYALALKGKQVEQERLLILNGKREELVYERSAGKASLGAALTGGMVEDERIFLRVLAEKVDADVLFLHHAQSVNIPALHQVLNPVRHWFGETLQIIGADSPYLGLGLDMFQRSDAYARALSRVDTGISGIRKDKLEPEQLGVLSVMLDEFRQQEGVGVMYFDDSTFAVKEGGEVNVYRCSALHRGSAGREVPFLLQDESDGTRRLMHLLPAVLAGDSAPKVFVIDEMDRSLHTALSRMLIGEHRRQVREGMPRQMVFTTHDVMLMDQDLLRRDEMWAAEKGGDQASHLIAFEEFIDIRKDKDIRRSYLQGRMGGVPKLLSTLC